MLVNLKTINSIQFFSFLYIFQFLEKYCPLRPYFTTTSSYLWKYKYNNSCFLKEFFIWNYIKIIYFLKTLFLILVYQSKNIKK